MSRGLNLYFLSDPNQADLDVMATEAKIVRDYVPIKDPWDFVAKVLLAVSYHGRNIEALTISGHGWSNHITIGTVQISPINFHEFAGALALLRPHFQKNAVVTLWECRVAQRNSLLQMLSIVWGGVKVQAYTGDVDVWNWKWFGGMKGEGDVIACMYTNCWTGQEEVDPRNSLNDVLPPH